MTIMAGSMAADRQSTGVRAESSHLTHEAERERESLLGMAWASKPTPVTHLLQQGHTSKSSPNSSSS